MIVLVIGLFCVGAGALALDRPIIGLLAIFTGFVAAAFTG